jgi:hypothetical protein
LSSRASRLRQLPEVGRTPGIEGEGSPRGICLAVAAFPNVAPLGGPVLAPGHAADLVKVDVKTLATGYRTSKVLGSTVVNAANETFGKVDDLIAAHSFPVPVQWTRQAPSKCRAPRIGRTKVPRTAAEDAIVGHPEFRVRADGLCCGYDAFPLAGIAPWRATGKPWLPTGVAGRSATQRNRPA